MPFIISQHLGLNGKLQTPEGVPYVLPPGPSGAGTNLLWALDAGRSDLVYTDLYTTNATNGQNIASVKSTVGDWGFLQVVNAADTPLYTEAGSTGSYFEFNNQEYLEMTTSAVGGTSNADAWDSSLNSNNITMYVVAENVGTPSGSGNDNIFSFSGTPWTNHGPKLYYWSGDLEFAFGNWSSGGVQLNGYTWPSSGKYILILRGSTTSNCTMQLATSGGVQTEITGPANPSYTATATSTGRSLLGAAYTSGNPWTDGSIGREYDGKIYEYGCFDSYLTDLQVAALFTYFNNKHNIY